MIYIYVGLLLGIYWFEMEKKQKKHNLITKSLSELHLLIYSVFFSIEKGGVSPSDVKMVEDISV